MDRGVFYFVMAVFAILLFAGCSSGKAGSSSNNQAASTDANNKVDPTKNSGYGSPTRGDS